MATAHAPWHDDEHPSPRTLRFALLAFALWAISGVTVFCVLCARENQSLQSLSARVAPQHTLSAKPVQPAIARSRYDVFRLGRSVRSLHQVGPIKVGIRRINVRRKSCDLSVFMNHRVLTERHLGINRPRWITIAGENRPLEIMITRISKRRVSGYIRLTAND